MKKPALLIGICIVSVCVWAHEFWFQPQKFYFRVREVANLRLRVGEDMKGVNWAGNRERVKELIHYTPSGDSLDIAPLISSSPGDSLQLPLQEEGTHMIIFNSTNSFITLDPVKFSSYLAEDGLNHVLAYRKNNHEEQKAGKEHYQRSIKTLLQVGEKPTDACLEPTRLPLDIVPEENPYGIKTGTNGTSLKVRFRILFKGVPLFNALVKTWYTIPGIGVKTDTLRTNRKGWVTATRHPGVYLVSCVYMEHVNADAEAEWQSYWASLSFEYPHFFPGIPTR